MSQAKTPYTSPQVFKVDLNPEQAILATCSDGVTSLVGKGNARCKPVQIGIPQGCKNDSGGPGGDFAARAS